MADFDRPLKKRGRLGAQRIGAWLRAQDLTPDYVLASPAERALSTAQLCLRAMQPCEAWVRTDRRLYLADVDELLAVLTTVPDECRRLLLVGHNPGLEDLLALLSATPLEQPADGKVLLTATLAQLRFGGDWSGVTPGQARLLRMVRAKDLV